MSLSISIGVQQSRFKPVTRNTVRFTQPTGVITPSTSSSLGQGLGVNCSNLTIKPKQYKIHTFLEWKLYFYFISRHHILAMTLGFILIPSCKTNGQEFHKFQPNSNHAHIILIFKDRASVLLTEITLVQNLNQYFKVQHLDLKKF